MEPKYLAFRRWLYTPIIIWQGDWIPRECSKYTLPMDPMGYNLRWRSPDFRRINSFTSRPHLHVSVVICWGWSHEPKKRRAWRTGLAWGRIELQKSSQVKIRCFWGLDLYHFLRNPSSSIGRFFESALIFWIGHMGVSNNRGTPQWMVYNGKPY